MSVEQGEVPKADGSEYPVIGESTDGLGAYLVRSGQLQSEDAYARLKAQAVEITRRCRRFSPADGSLTGLVIGHVQSGKTMAMTTVSALARDNGCRIIVLLAGVTINLLKQNAERLRRDLREASGNSAWRIVNSNDWPDAFDQSVRSLANAVSEWRSPAIPEADRQTFLFLVLKQHQHLERLAELFERHDLHGVPSLILDDEADQAGLNTKPQKPEVSTTFSRIRRVRNALPNHTYLQFTATPQAPLLIALDDMLSPAFAELLEPGAGYTGGERFFSSGSPPGLVRRIPEDDLFDAGNPPVEPPESLLEALRLFFVGAAVAATRWRPTPCSMLIHPSARTSDHGRYSHWVSEISKRMSEGLRSTDPGLRQATLDEFRVAYDDLAATDPKLPPFDDGLARRILLTLSRFNLKEVNGEDASDVDWQSAEAHILVGGEKLNRGFTVEGLMTTYMPRGPGDWNADTIQQRARFFGYKESYITLCRIFLSPDVARAFESYVVHEKELRKQLLRHRGKPLREWRRAFFLDSDMRPTRRNVMTDPYYKVPKEQPWFLQRYPHVEPDAIAHNTALVTAFEATRRFANDERFYSHGALDLPLEEVFRELLVSFDVRSNDRPSWYATLLALKALLESNPGARALVLRMSGDRERAKNNDAIAIHQGASSKEGGYPGDNKMASPDLVTVQIHRIDVKETALKRVPALAVFVPPAFRQDVGVQVPY